MTDRLVVVPSGPYVYDRALKEAIQQYGLNVSIDQVGWTDDQTIFEVADDLSDAYEPDVNG